MTRFTQVHLLTVYPPSNPNRDDQGRPKTAVYGGVTRLRLSSQSLKRAARLSDAMKKGLEGHMGERTQRMGDEVRVHLLETGAAESRADEIARDIADLFGKVDEEAIKKNPAHVRIRQLAFVSPDERRAAFAWADRFARRRGEARQHQGDCPAHRRRRGRRGHVRAHARERSRLQPGGCRAALPRHNHPQGGGGG